MAQSRDLSGLRFGRLTVECRGPQTYKKSGKSLAQWHCRCDCGSTLLVRGESLRGGNTQSCGCLFKEGARARFYTHGQAGTALYQAWSGMKSRCYNTANHKFPDYGERGIEVCPEWRDNFEAFQRDMGPRPPGTSIDRIDNDGNYEPGNCRWATVHQQARNKRTVILVPVGDRLLTGREYAEERGVRPRALYKHMARHGLTAQEAADKILAGIRLPISPKPTSP